MTPFFTGLTLNIMRPDNASSSSNLPVVVVSLFLEIKRSSRVQTLSDSGLSEVGRLISRLVCFCQVLFQVALRQERHTSTSNLFS